MSTTSFYPLCPTKGFRCVTHTRFTPTLHPERRGSGPRGQVNGRRSRSLPRVVPPSGTLPDKDVSSLPKDSFTSRENLFPLPGPEECLRRTTRFLTRTDRPVHLACLGTWVKGGPEDDPLSAQAKGPTTPSSVPNTVQDRDDQEVKSRHTSSKLVHRLRKDRPSRNLKSLYGSL